MSPSLRRWFLLNFVLAVAIGTPLWLVPGHTLTTIGWVPESVRLPESDLSVPGATFSNPIFVRLVGSVFLALAGANLWSWRARHFQEVIAVVKFQCAFSALATLAIVASRVRSTDYFPLFGWVGLALFALLFLAWGFALVSENRAQQERSRASAKHLPSSPTSSPDYLLNLEETIAQLRGLTETVTDSRLRSRILKEVGALDAIASVVRISKIAETGEDDTDAGTPVAEDSPQAKPPVAGDSSQES